MIHLLTVDFPPAFVGGIASWAEDLSRGLVDAHERVLVYCKATGASGQYDRLLPFTVHRVPGRKWSRTKSVLLPVELLTRVDPSQDQVVFATWDIAWLAGPMLAQRGIRYGIAFHGSDLTRLQGTPRRLKRAVKGASALLPVSGFLNDELERRVGVRGTVLPMPVPIAESPTIRRGEGLLVVARLNHLKGVDRVFRIARELKMPVRVVGDGPARQPLEVEAMALGVDVDFVGAKPRVRVLDLYREHAACILTPRLDEAGQGAEGLGLTLLEARGQGVPAIGGPVGGVPEAADLVLTDPDDAVRSAGEVEAFLAREDVGRVAWESVQRDHGPELAAHALQEALA